MKVVGVFFCLIVNICVFAQSKKEFYSNDLIYGNVFLKQNFNNQLNTIQNHQFFKSLQTIGFSSLGNYLLNKKTSLTGPITYSQIIPLNVNLSNGQSGRINGFILGLNILGKNLLPNSNSFNIIASIGVNTGRIRISGDDFTTQKNPFFCPTITIQPRIKIKKMVLALRAEYSFDLSSSLWRSLNITKSKGAITLPNYSQTGLNLYFLIGKIPK